MKTRSKILTLLFLILFVFSIPLTGYANDKAEAVVWSFYDEDTVFDGERCYKYQSLPIGYFLNEDSVFKYSNTIEVSDSFYESVDKTIYSYMRGGDFVWLEDPYSGYDVGGIYVARERESAIDEFFAGKYEYLVIETTNTVSDKLSKTFITDAKSTAVAMVNVPVKQLLDTQYSLYSIKAYDETGALYYIYGQLIESGGEYYLLDYTELDNSCFDADGNFSYRSGSVDLYKLSEISASGAKALLDSLSNKSFHYESEGFDDIIEIDNDLSVVLFWIMIALLGFAAPIILFVLGMLLPKSKKHNGERRWYVLSWLAIPWIICAITLTLIILIA